MKQPPAKGKIPSVGLEVVPQRLRQIIIMIL
jgi:hypothetical protein